MNAEINRLLALINYAQEVMSSRNRAITDVSDHGNFFLSEDDALTLNGIQLSRGNTDRENIDDEWLRVAKPPLEESVPQPSSPLLVPWLQLNDSPDESPKLAEKVPSSVLAKLEQDSADPLSFGGGREGGGTDDWCYLQNYSLKQELEREFSNYSKTTWNSWAAREKNRRRAVKIYTSLFTLHQQLGGSLAEHQMELIWGIGMATYLSNDQIVKYPVISQVMDLSFDDKSGAAVIRPRNIEARFELDVFMPIQALTAALKNIHGMREIGGIAAVNPFEIDSYAESLGIAKDILTNYSPESEIEFQRSWVLFARPRSSNIAVQDLERFRDFLCNLHDDYVLPPAIQAILNSPPDYAHNKKFPAYRGVSFTHQKSDFNGCAPDLYFPKPFNSEQARVASLLDVSDGVVVQGPPGTGKTHTIANIICHSLANGERVLISSMREPALAVLRDMLPKELRPLVISLLATEHDGISQFVESVEHIAYGVQRLDQDRARSDIKILEEQIDALHGRISVVDEKISRWAELNLSPVKIDEESIYPQDAANEIQLARGTFEWIPDKLGIGKEFEPQFSIDDIARLKRLLNELGDNLVFLDDVLPDSSRFPDSLSLTKIHGDLQRFTRLTDKARKTEWPWPENANEGTLQSARELAKEVRRVSSKWGHLLGARMPWSDAVVMRIRRGEPKRFFDTLDELGKDLEKLSVERAVFLKKPVTVPEAALLDATFLMAVKNLAEGKRPYSITARGKSKIKGWLSLTRIGGMAVQGQHNWAHVYKYVILYQSRQELTSRWNVLVPEIGLHPVLSVDTKGQLSAEGQFAFFKALRELTKEQRKLALKSSEVFPDWARAAELVVNPLIIDELSYALEYHLSRHGLSTVSNSVDELKAIAGASSGRVADYLIKFLSDKLGNPDVEASIILREWEFIREEIKRVTGFLMKLKEVKNLVQKISDSGGEKLGFLLLAVSESKVDLLPEAILRHWRLKRLEAYIQSIDPQKEVHKLSMLRVELEGDLVSAYEKLLIERTWVRLTNNITPAARASLQNYLNAIQRIGKGTGKRVHRFRREARNAALEAQKAVPCWIMPHNRFSETLPAEIGSFDLVIIDEASQSDLSALPVLLRGSKLLVVGDDRQVAPQAIGMEEDRLKELMNKHLEDQIPAFRNQLSPDRSIYDLARVVFAKNGVMLKEHFRCVAPIIEYSKKQFYKHELKPLRLPLASEVIAPPLVDVKVKNGRREKTINSAEIEFIVQDIARICNDQRFVNRSIGVVSLLGQEQANKIWGRLLEVLETSVLKKHRIVCGDARMFQGRERDIIYLSMVVAPNDLGSPLSSEVFSQRFNVAASRARDQMVLVRSVEKNDLLSGDYLRHSLIDHFSQPFESNSNNLHSIGRDLCDSSLERDIFDWLKSSGYRFRPKVAVGIHIVDFVVEGVSDKRLAIECDGDKYQGPESWTQSIEKQRALERTGWKFWRCFASSFILSRDKIIDELEATLRDYGILPDTELEYNDKITASKEVNVSASELIELSNVRKFKRILKSSKL